MCAASGSLKQHTVVDGVSLDECNRVYNMRNVTVTPKQICAGGEKSAEFCERGPLLARDLSHPMFYLVGVDSFGLRCGLDGSPGVYTRVSSYNDWILSHMHRT